VSKLWHNQLWAAHPSSALHSKPARLMRSSAFADELRSSSAISPALSYLHRTSQRTSASLDSCVACSTVWYSLCTMIYPKCLEAQGHITVLV
jgi:hypothetical protein